MQTGYMPVAVDTMDIDDISGQGYENGANIKGKNYGLPK
jgi:hypothetical protein